MIQFFARILSPFLKLLDWLQPLADLAARLWVSWIFLESGLVKIHAWQSTVMLFTYQYHVPWLPPYFAAVLGTACELILPILLTLGLGGRITILVFFIYNIVAVISYHYLWTPVGWNGLEQHVSWGLLLAMLMTFGSSKLSLDYWIRKEYEHLLKK
jgi:putative oxidoreductase